MIFFARGLFLSCQNFTEHDGKITNSSGGEVTFLLERYGRGPCTLSSGGSVTLVIFNNPALVFDGCPGAGYTSGGFVNIFDLTACTLKIFNNTESGVVLKEKRSLLGEESGAGGISAGKEYSQSSENPLSPVIYTKNPVFTAVSSDGEETFSCSVSKSAENSAAVFILNIEK